MYEVPERKRRAARMVGLLMRHGRSVDEIAALVRKGRGAVLAWLGGTSYPTLASVVVIEELAREAGILVPGEGVK